MLVAAHQDRLGHGLDFDRRRGLALSRFELCHHLAHQSNQVVRMEIVAYRPRLQPSQIEQL